MMRNIKAEWCNWNYALRHNALVNKFQRGQSKINVEQVDHNWTSRNLK